MRAVIFEAENITHEVGRLGGGGGGTALPCSSGPAAGEPPGSCWRRRRAELQRWSEWPQLLPAWLHSAHKHMHRFKAFHWQLVENTLQSDTQRVVMARKAYDFYAATLSMKGRHAVNAPE